MLTSTEDSGAPESVRSAPSKNRKAFPCQPQSAKQLGGFLGIREGGGQLLERARPFLGDYEAGRDLLGQRQEIN